MFIRLNQINISTLQFVNEIGLNAFMITQFYPRTVQDTQSGAQLTLTVLNLVGYPEEEVYTRDSFDAIRTVLNTVNVTAPPTPGPLDYCAVSPNPPGAIIPASMMVQQPYFYTERINNENSTTVTPVTINPTHITWFETKGYQDRKNGVWRTDSVVIHTRGAPIRLVHANVSFNSLCTFLYAVAP